MKRGKSPSLLIRTKNRPADIIINEGRVDGPVKRFESQFFKDIREMMEGHAERNIKLYAASIERRRYLLLKEKLTFEVGAT